jgi:protein-disulfide isomerase-like protein with CxxC motif
MSSNPDEFTPDLRNGYPPKWRNIILSVEMRTKGGKDYQDQLPFLSDKEIKALWQKMQELQGELFTKQVMNTLLRDAEDGLGYSEVIELIEAKAKQAELSSLSRRVTGGSPKGSF